MNLSAFPLAQQCSHLLINRAIEPVNRGLATELTVRCLELTVHFLELGECTQAETSSKDKVRLEPLQYAGARPIKAHLRRYADYRLSHCR